MNKNLTDSQRKFIRLEKSKIRKKFWDVKKQEEAITELYKRVSGDPTAKVEVAKKPVKKVVKVDQKSQQKKSKAKPSKGEMKNKKKVK